MYFLIKPALKDMSILFKHNLGQQKQTKTWPQASASVHEHKDPKSSFLLIRNPGPKARRNVLPYFTVTSGEKSVTPETNSILLAVSAQHEALNKSLSVKRLFLWSLTRRSVSGSGGEGGSCSAGVWHITSAL